MEAIHVNEGVDRRNQTIPLLVECMEKQQVEEGPNHSEEVHVLPNPV